VLRLVIHQVIFTGTLRVKSHFHEDTEATVCTGLIFH